MASGNIYIGNFVKAVENHKTVEIESKEYHVKNVLVYGKYFYKVYYKNDLVALFDDKSMDKLIDDISNNKYDYKIID